MVKKKTESVVTNAPTPDEILKEMGQTAPVVTDSKEVADLMAGYTEQLVIDEPTAQAFEQGKPKKDGRGRPKKDKGTTEQSQPVIEGEAMISGALMLMLIDLALPNLIAFANNKFNKKGKKIKASDLQMGEEERKGLEPVADQVAKEMMLKASPLSVLIVSMISIYGIKFMMLKSGE